MKLSTLIDGPDLTTLQDVPEETEIAPTTGRRARQRAATRSRLVDAARTLFAAQGVDATRINEITEKADVGFGSFYNYFESKDAILRAVLDVTMVAAADALSTIDLQDPAEVVSVAHRHFVAQAAADPEWGWLIVRLEASHGTGMAALGPYAARDLHRGLDSGRFDVADAGVALVAAGGALVGVIRAVLDGDLDKDAGEHHAAGVLRSFGVEAAEAAEVARRPMPEAIATRTSRRS